MIVNEIQFGTNGKVVFQNGKLRIQYGTAPAWTDYITIDTNGLIVLPGATAAASALRFGTDMDVFRAAGALNFQTSSVTVYSLADDSHTWKGASSGKNLFYIAANQAQFGLAMANGQSFNVKTLTELTTIAAAATTDTTIQIPLNAVVFYVSVRTTTAIPTAATYTVIGTTTSTAFNRAAVGTGADSTDVGTLNCPYANGAAQTVRITPNVTPADNTGRVRVTIQYYDVTVPTS